MLNGHRRMRECNLLSVQRSDQIKRTTSKVRGARMDAGRVSPNYCFPYRLGWWVAQPWISLLRVISCQIPPKIGHLMEKIPLSRMAANACQRCASHSALNSVKELSDPALHKTETRPYSRPLVARSFRYFFLKSKDEDAFFNLLRKFSIARKCPQN